MNNTNNKGQVMLVTIIALSATLLSATTIAGLLMLYQLRQSSDAVNSAKAIFAADAGLEWRKYNFFKVDGQKCLNNDCPTSSQCPIFSNKAVISKTSCVSKVINGAETIVIRSTGAAQKNARAFEETFTKR